jgi:hypothetical protein
MHANPRSVDFTVRVEIRLLPTPFVRPWLAVHP